MRLPPSLRSFQNPERLAAAARGQRRRSKAEQAAGEYPWRDGEWIAAPAAFEMLQDRVSDPGNEMTIWARKTTDRPLLRVRAKLVQTDFEAGAPTIKRKDAPVHFLRWSEREGVPQGNLKTEWAIGRLTWESNWGSGEGVRITAIGVEVSADDLGFTVIAERSPSATAETAGRKPFDRSSPWADVARWYQDRVQSAPPSGFTRREDEGAAAEVGIGRDRLRDLRKEFAPEGWHKPGPQSGG